MRLSSKEAAKIQWKLIIKSIENQEVGTFSRLLKSGSSIISAPDDKGSTVVHLIAANANAGSVAALRHLIAAAEQTGLSKATVLNAKNGEGCTALTVCVKSTNLLNLSARLLLILELLNQGADPRLGNESPLKFSQNEMKAIKQDPVLTAGYLEWVKIIKPYFQHHRMAVAQAALKPLSLLACSSSSKPTVIEKDNPPTPS